MKKTLFILLITLLPVVALSQTRSTSLGTKMYGNLHMVRGSDTIFIQTDTSYMSIWSSVGKIFLSDSVIVDSLDVRFWLNAGSASIDSISTNYFTDGTLVIESGDITGGTYNGLSITTGTNTFNLTRGTASLDLATGVVIDFNSGLTVNTNAGTISFSAPAKTITVEDTFTGGLDLNALEALSSTGIVSRTAANTYSPRTITGTTNQIVVLNGDGVSGNPTISLSDSIIISAGSINYETDPYFQSLLGSAAYMELDRLPVLDTEYNLTLDGEVMFNSEHINSADVVDDASFIIPAGYILKYIVMEETAGNAATLDLGTTSGGNDLFINQTVAASDITTFVINKVFSTSAAQTIYLNDDDAGSTWNSASVDIYVVMEKVL